MEHAVKRRYKNKIYINIIKALYSVFQAYYNNDFVKSKEFYFVVDKFKIISNITLFTFHSGTEKEFKRIVISLDIISLTQNKQINIFHWQIIDDDKEIFKKLNYDIAEIYNKGFKEFEEVIPLLKKYFSGRMTRLNNAIKTIIKEIENKI